MQWNGYECGQQMKNHRWCKECQAIAREIGEAYSDAWAFGGQAFRDAWIATHNLIGNRIGNRIGGTEEDAGRAEELLSTSPCRDPLRINRALHRKLAHEARSGQHISLAAEPCQVVRYPRNPFVDTKNNRSV